MPALFKADSVLLAAQDCRDLVKRNGLDETRVRFVSPGDRAEAAGFRLGEVTRDLHGAGPVGIMNDYEKKFYGEGKPICRLVARL